MKRYRLHNVLPNETIESIARLYSIDVYKLIMFHNHNCENSKDLIFITTNINKIKNIYVPRDLSVDKSKLVKFNQFNKLVLKPETNTKKYAIRIVIETNTSVEVKFEASIKWLKSTDQKHYFEIDRISPPYINSQELNLMADILAFETAKVLYPMQIAVDTTGKYITVETSEGLVPDFIAKWHQVKSTIYKQFEGITVDNYLLKMENIIADKANNLSFYLKNDFFIRTLFFGVYLNYVDEYSIEVEKTFPIIKHNIEPNYKLKMQVDPLIDEYGLITISGKGTLFETRTSTEIFKGVAFSEFNVENNVQVNTNGKINAKYFLNAQTKLVEHAFLECSIFDDEIAKKISINISSI